MRFIIQLYAVPDSNKVEEVIARMRDLVMAHHTYAEAVARWPDRLVMLCEGGQILKRSDRAS